MVIPFLVIPLQPTFQVVEYIQYINQLPRYNFLRVLLVLRLDARDLTPSSPILQPAIYKYLLYIYIYIYLPSRRMESPLLTVSAVQILLNPSPFSLLKPNPNIIFLYLN